MFILHKNSDHFTLSCKACTTFSAVRITRRASHERKSPPCHILANVKRRHPVGVQSAKSSLARNHVFLGNGWFPVGFETHFGFDLQEILGICARLPLCTGDSGEDTDSCYHTTVSFALAERSPQQ